MDSVAAFVIGRGGGGIERRGVEGGKERFGGGEGSGALVASELPHSADGM